MPELNKCKKILFRVKPQAENNEKRDAGNIVR